MELNHNVSNLRVDYWVVIFNVKIFIAQIGAMNTLDFIQLYLVIYYRTYPYLKQGVAF